MLLRFRGGSALSPFRQEKLAAALATAAPQVSHIYAEYWYFCAAAENLRQDEIAILEDLLDCACKDNMADGGAATQKAGCPPGSELLLVLPRPGTISPWSTKATDIAHHCGLGAVGRLERGVAFHIQTRNKAYLSPDTRGKLL